MNPRIAICVDDFGLHAGVDGAVLDLHDRGRITAVSCIVGGSSWKDNAPALRELSPATIDVGLHLDLTEHPQDPALALPLRQWVIRSFLRRCDAAALNTEIHAQLDAFERAIGRPPAHVDGHQHVHQFPVVRDELLRVLLQRYGTEGALPWVRSTRHGPRAAPKAWLIQALGCRGLHDLCARSGLRQNARLLGVYDFLGTAQRYESLLAGWIAAAGDGDLLMCHPAQHADSADPIGRARMNEYAVLGGGALLPMLDSARANLAPLSAMATGGARRP